jgi:hypothetical protein
MRILFAGQLWKGSTGRYRSEAFRQLGCDVVEVDLSPPDRSVEWRFTHRALNRLGYPPDLSGANRRLRELAHAEPVQILWIEKGRTVRPSTLRAFRAAQPGAKVVAYSPDNMLFRPNQSRAYVAGAPLYDLHVTTKRMLVDEMRGRLRAREVMFSPNAYDPDTHRPIELSAAERARWGSEVVFVGQADADRIGMLTALCDAGIEVTVHGPYWDRYRGAHPRLRVGEPYVSDQDYARAVSGARISLGFLRRDVGDRQTQRSVEIPACGGFMLADRSDEHLALFAEGEEAAYFGSVDELVEKAVYYLEHDDERRRIARAGRERCLRDGYSYAARIRDVLEHLGLQPPAAVEAR